MPARSGRVHVATTTRTYKGRVYCTHLLRRTYREDGKVKNETVGNLSHLPDHIVDLVRRALRGESFAASESAFEIVSSRSCGAVQAVRTAMKRLGFESLIAAKQSRERNLVTAMVAARILEPASKLATQRWWKTTSLPDELGVSDASEDDLYNAMDWLIARQAAIEKKLAARHLHEDGLVLYDLTSRSPSDYCLAPRARGRANRLIRSRWRPLRVSLLRALWSTVRRNRPRGWNQHSVPEDYRLAAASFSRLWAVQTRLHSAATFWRPRSRNCRNPRACLI
jgi:hypothetical protein